MGQNAIRILILEDSSADAKLLLRCLEKDGLDFEYRLVDTREEFIASLKEYKPEIILSDHQLGSFNSREALDLSRRYLKDIPFILVTGTVSEEFAVSILKQGATDYILKGNLSRLTVAIKSALAQKEANDKLKRSEENFQYTIDGMIDGVQIIDFDWRYLYVNNTVVSQSKFTKEELLGHTMMECYPEIEGTEMFQQLRKAMKERIVIEMENEFAFPDGTKEWFQLNIQPAPQGILVVSTDISEKKRSYEQLKLQNQKILAINQDLDRFLYSVSHELRTPICNGLGLVNLIRKIDDKKLIDEIADKLEASIQSQDALLQKIGMYTQIVRQDLVFEQIHLQNLLDNCISGLSGMDGFKQVEIYSNIQNGTPVLSNKKSLEILLTNLISNAIKFRRNTGAIVNINISGTAGGFRIEVEDNGRGIDKKYLNDIFKVFFKANDVTEGQGLGLYLVSKIVETLNGNITVSSDAGAGARFEVILPTRNLE